MGQTFLLVSRFTGATKRSFRPVRGNTPNHPIAYSRLSQLSPGSTRPGSTLTRPCVNSSPVSTRPRVNSSPSQLVLGSTRPRVNSNLGQLELGSTRPWVNSNSGQLVPESTRPRVNSSPCHTSSLSQLVPESTRPKSTRPLINSSPGQLAGIFSAIFGRGPRAFLIGKFSDVIPEFGKFSKHS